MICLKLRIHNKLLSKMVILSKGFYSSPICQMEYNKPLHIIRGLPEDTDFGDEFYERSSFLYEPDGQPEKPYRKFNCMPKLIQALVIANTGQCNFETPGQVVPYGPPTLALLNYKKAKIEFVECLGLTIERLHGSGLLFDSIPFSIADRMGAEELITLTNLIFRHLNHVILMPDEAETRLKIQWLLETGKYLGCYRNIFELLRSSHRRNWLQIVGGDNLEAGTVLHPVIRVFGEDGLSNHILEYAFPDTLFAFETLHVPSEGIPLAMEILDAIMPHLDKVTLCLTALLG